MDLLTKVLGVLRSWERVVTGDKLVEDNAAGPNVNCLRGVSLKIGQSRVLV